MSLDLNQTLDLRIAQFKNDPQKMAEVNEFLNDVFEKAQKEAEQRHNGKGPKGKLVSLQISFKPEALCSVILQFLSFLWFCW